MDSRAQSDDQSLTIIGVRIKEATSRIEAAAASLPAIYDDEGFQLVSQFLRTEVKRGLSLVREIFDPICESANRTHKEATEQRRKCLEPFFKAEAHAKQLLKDYAALCEQIAQEDSAQNAPLVDHRPTAEGISLRKQWAFTIVDPEAVPRHFCSPDPKKIRDVVQQLGLPAQAMIPGIEVKEVTGVAARA